MRLLAAQYRTESPQYGVHAVIDDPEQRTSTREGVTGGIYQTLCLQPKAAKTKIQLFNSPEDYEVLSFNGLLRDRCKAGLDYLDNLSLWKKNRRCPTCYTRAKLIEKLDLSEGQFTLLRTRDVPVRRWEEYAEYPTEWLESFLPEEWKENYDFNAT